MGLNIIRFNILSIFMIIHLTLFCLLSFLSLSAFADTFKLPENKPIVSFVLPESWKPTETDTGLEAVSVDGEIYLALEFVDADSVDDVIDANLKYLEQQGLKSKKSQRIRETRPSMRWPSVTQATTGPTKTELVRFR
jgi:hypothetical protein